MQLTEAPVRMQLRGASTGGSGPDLTGYPHLTYAPEQWGDGVRIARNGAEVDSILLDADTLAKKVDFLARAEGLTWDELFDVLRYGRANGALSDADR